MAQDGPASGPGSGSGSRREADAGAGTAEPEFRHGLVLGKFYPPHAGHHHLIRTAAARCARVTVVVLAATVESIPLADRVSWLQAVHRDDRTVRVVGDIDDHPVDYDDPVCWQAHVAVTAAAVVRARCDDGPGAVAVDAVFSSEPYGAELARRFGAASVVVDRHRVRFPVSGRAVRADLLGHWSQLAPATRAGLSRRVVVLGSESTGTTTLADALADALAARGGPFAGTTAVPEYGRDYTWVKLDGLAAQRLAPDPGVPAQPVRVQDLCWTEGDFTHIAHRQADLVDAAAASGRPVVVADTDTFATGVWHERYLGTRSAEVEALAARRPGHLYLVTDHRGVAFADDGIRDGRHLRAWMQERFLERLAEAGLRHEVLDGPPAQRLGRALELVDGLLAAPGFAEPLG